MSEGWGRISPVKSCTRFREDGSACTNQTDFADGWCHVEDCPGYLRADPAPAPKLNRSWQGATNRIRPPVAVPTGDVSVENLATVGVSKNAIDTFRDHHGGSRRQAEIQLRCMLEDFVSKSALSVSSGGSLKLARQGYVLILSPARDMIIGYSTGHRERTWEQIKAGVKSRFKKIGVRAASGSVPELGPPVQLSDFDTTFDPVTVHLTARVRTSYAKIAGLVEASDEQLDMTIRATCSELQFGSLIQREDGCFEISEDGRIWLVSPDCRSLFGVKNAVSLEISDRRTAAQGKAENSPKQTGRPNAKAAKSLSDECKGKKRKKSKSKRSKRPLRADLLEYWDNDRAKDERVDRRTKSRYLGIYSVKSVTSGGLPGHGKRR